MEERREGGVSLWDISSVTMAWEDACHRCIPRNTLIAPDTQPVVGSGVSFKLKSIHRLQDWIPPPHTPSHTPMQHQSFRIIKKQT